MLLKHFASANQIASKCSRDKERKGKLVEELKAEKVKSRKQRQLVVIAILKK